MRFDEQEIVQACRDLWRSNLGLNLDRSAETPTPDEPVYASRVDLSGGWDGSVVLECPRSVGRHAAAMLFSVDADCLDDDELQAAVDELTRLVGKNLARRLDEPGRLSTPRAHDPSADVASDGLESLAELDFDCEGRRCRVRLLTAAGAALTTG